MSEDAYKQAGVDIDAADRLVDRIKPLASATNRPGVMGSLGGFGGLFDLQGKYKDPILVSGTDGVGTKLLVAQQADNHRTIGIDLVAMCVNDIAVLGAEPLFFLDYFSTGRLDNDVAVDIIAGIADGCKLSGCALLGGETAEMPGMYSAGHYDLAGFAVGAVERSEIRDGQTIHPGDKLLAIPSSGLHSNGYSLVRKVLFQDNSFSLQDTPSPLGRTLAEELLEPTRIYVPEMLKLAKESHFKGAAHITGGGIPGNVIRMLPEGCQARINLDSWTFPPIFQLLQAAGSLTTAEMHKTFNCGLGMVVAIPAEEEQNALQCTGGFIVGDVVSGTRGVVLR
jgi:phosphoribosylformylglycinamidine cyclo-ligase